MTGLAWDHQNGLLYAVDNAGLFAVADFSGLTVSPAYASGQAFVALAVHGTTGRIYAISAGAGGAASVPALYEVDLGDRSNTASGSLTKIADLDFTVNTADASAWDADFDDSTGELYLNLREDDAQPRVLRSIDLATGETLFRDNPGQASLAMATAPAPPAVRWTSDLVYDSTPPHGIQLDADSNVLPGDTAGAQVTGVGDVNGDGFEDVLVADSEADGGQGRVFVLFGGETGVTDALMDYAWNKAVFGGDFPAGPNGIVIRGGAGEHLGRTASGAGDVNGDGISDFVLGYTDSALRGGAYLVYGDRLLAAEILTSQLGDPSLGASAAGVKIRGAANGDDAGSSVSGAGDFNSDGLGDFIIGTGAGDETYIIFGSLSHVGAGGLLNLSTLAPPAGIRIQAEAAGDHFGQSVSGAGDVNGDGVDDVIIGAPYYEAQKGAAYVLFGHQDYAEADAPSPIDLGRLRDTAGPFGAPTLVLTTVIPRHGGA